MESSGCAGVMAVVVVSSSVVLVAFQIHKRLVSDFMKKVQLEAGFLSLPLVALQIHKRLVSDFMKKFQLEPCGVNNNKSKKKVRFAADIIDASVDNKEYRKRRYGSQINCEWRSSH